MGPRRESPRQPLVLWRLRPRSVKPKPLAAHWLRSDVHTAVGEHCIGQFPRTAAHFFDSRHRNPDYRFNRPISVQFNGDNLANRIYYTSSNFGSQVENQVAPGAAPTGLADGVFRILIQQVSSIGYCGDALSRRCQRVAFWLCVRTVYSGGSAAVSRLALPQ